MSTDEILQLSTRTVYRNRWLTLREDMVRFPGGHEGIYSVLEKPDFALIVPIHEDGSIRMVEQYRYPVGQRMWELPQGAWETAPDTPLLAVAHAELQEETGFTAARMEPVGQLFEASGHANHAMHIFVATGLTAGPPRRETEEAGMTTAAFTPEAILDMLRAGELRDAATVAALGWLKLTGHPGF